MNISLPQCVLTLRLIGVAFDLLDGARASVGPSLTSSSTREVRRAAIVLHTTAEAEAKGGVWNGGWGAREAPRRADRDAVATGDARLRILLQRLSRRPTGARRDTVI